VEGPDIVCIVIFRGAWCKYDKHYLTMLGRHHMTVEAKEKVRLVAWTSEGTTGAAKADNDWGLTKEYGYDAVLGDDSNALANYLIEDEILPGLVIKSPLDAKVQDLVEPGSYPNGIVMPGMIWYAHHGNMVFQWVTNYDESCHAPGGPGRPEPDDLWKQVMKRKHALDLGNAVMPSHGTDVKLCTTDEELESVDE
jgi:hypothetical protein